MLPNLRKQIKIKNKKEHGKRYAISRKEEITKQIKGMKIINIKLGKKSL